MTLANKFFLNRLNHADTVDIKWSNNLDNGIHTYIEYIFNQQ